MDSLSGLIGKPFVGAPAQGFAPVAVPWLADVPLLGRMFFQHDLLVYVAYLLVPCLWVLLYFGGVQALQLRLQAIGVAVPTYVLMMTPYAFTILALIIVSARRARRHLDTPTALGTVYIRGE